MVNGRVALLSAKVEVRAGLNVYKNVLTYKAVADAQHIPFKSAESVLGM